MTRTLVKVKQKRRRITLQKDPDGDSRVTKTEFDERIHLSSNMIRAMRKLFDVYVCVGDDAMTL